MVDRRHRTGLAEYKKSYEDNSALVRVTIVGAQGWQSTKSPMDLYCVGEVQDDASARTQTPVVKYTVAPTWNHTWELAKFNVSKMLNFSVWEKKEPHNSCLGRVTLEPNQFIPNGFNGAAILKAVSKGSGATLSLKIETIDLSLQRANNIRPGDKISKGTILVCITNADIYALVGSQKKVGRVKAGDKVQVAGRTRDSDDQVFVPIEPRGAVNLACFDLVREATGGVAPDAIGGKIKEAMSETTLAPEDDDDVAYPSTPESTVSSSRVTSRRASRQRLQDASVAGMQQVESTAKAYNLQRLFVKLQTKAETQRELDLREQRRKEREALERELSEQAIRRQVNAAIKIQSAVRSKLARLKLELENRKKREDELLAKEARRREQEVQVQRKQIYLAKKRLQEMHSKKLNEFATRIQSLRRGQLGRREARRLRNIKDRAVRMKQRDKTWKMIQDVEARNQEKAALRVQRTWRWHKLRRWLKKEAERAANEKRIRGHGQRMLRVQEKRKLDIIVKVQSTWRGRKARAEVRSLLKEKERKEYEREVVRILELKKIQGGARRAEEELETSDELRQIRETQREKEEDITRWLQEQEEVWRWCLEQESRYAQLRKSVEAGADGDLSKWREEEATQWQSYQRGDAAVNILHLLDSSKHRPKGRSPLPAADVLRLDSQSATISPSSPRSLRSPMINPTFKETDSFSEESSIPRGRHLRALGSPDRIDKILGSPRVGAQDFEDNRQPQYAKLVRKKQIDEGPASSPGLASLSATDEYGYLDDTEVKYSILRAEEQRCQEKYKEVLPAKRNDILRQRWKLAVRCSEHMQLQLLLSLNANNKRCYRCDVGLASLQMLMQALEGVCRIIHEMFTQRKNEQKKASRTAVIEIMELIAPAVVVDPSAQEYGDEILKLLREEVPVPPPKEPNEVSVIAPSPELEKTWHKVFEGHWKKEGSSSRYVVKGERVTFLDNNARHEFQDRGRGGCAMNVLGDIFQGRFVRGGGHGKDRIRWTNGSSDWVRDVSVRAMINS